jgi:uncharacterized repeat protein (TIGR03803 family)
MKRKMIRDLALSLVVLGSLSIYGAGVSAQAVSYTTLHAFKGGSDGAAPTAAVIHYGGRLYGTTPHGGEKGDSDGLGTIFWVNPLNDYYAVAYAFKGGKDGEVASSSLLYSGGFLYGTTVAGGAAGDGTIFAFNPNTNAETVTYSFKGGKDGLSPDSNLVKVGGTLYGTTSFGGSGLCSDGTYTGCGTVFAFIPGTGQEKVVYSFGNGTDGSYPIGLISVGGILYGTTHSGGTGSCDNGPFNGCGTIFTFNPTTGVETVLYRFTGESDGANPYAGLTYYNGYLYGTAYTGGLTACPSGGCGTIFSLNLKTKAFKILYSFGTNSGDGSNPIAGLIEAGGTLYGTTPSAGNMNNGTVFSLNVATGVESVLYSFNQNVGGAYPFASLTNVDGTLYGTTTRGGASCYSYGSCGTVFALSPQTADRKPAR